jgi:hypothetical protein
MDNGHIWFAKDNVWQGSGNPATGANPAFTDLLSADTYKQLRFHVSIRNRSTSFWDGGIQGFVYTPPTGFRGLSTAVLPEADITNPSEHFNTVLYTGNGSTQNITGVGFQPDLVWIKSRSSVSNHRLYDAVRGATKEIYSNSTTNEVTVSNSLTSFNSDGFSLGSDSGPNSNGTSYIAWCWKAGNSTSSNTDGTITSTVSANPTAGFSIVSYTGTNSVKTVGHGLGVAPQMIIFKNRNDTSDWVVYHQSIGATKYIKLNSPDAAATSSSPFNNTAPTSTVFSVGVSGSTNGSSDAQIAYCWAEVPGYSAFGSYVGNASTDGPVVYTGFRPAFVLIKNANNNNDWVLHDTARSQYNPCTKFLMPNLTNSETDESDKAIDIVSNGFIVRGTHGRVNRSGDTLIFMAFAEHPFGGNNVYPANAR